MPLIGGITVRERPEKYPGQPRYKRLDFVKEPDADYESWPVLKSSFQIPTILVQETAEPARIEPARVERPEVEYVQPLQIEPQRYSPHFYQHPHHQEHHPQPQFRPQYQQQYQPYYRSHPQTNFQQQYQNPPPAPPPPPPQPAPSYRQYHQPHLDYHHPRGAIEYNTYQPGIGQYLPPPDDDEDGILTVVDPYYVEAKPHSRTPNQIQLISTKKKSKTLSRSRRRGTSQISYETEYDSDDSCAHLQIPHRRRLKK